MRHLPSLLLAHRLRRSVAVTALALMTLTGTVAPAAVPAAHAESTSSGGASLFTKVLHGPPGTTGSDNFAKSAGPVPILTPPFECR